MNTLYYKYVCLFGILPISIFGQQWPINSTDDPTNWNVISCPFGEIHGTTIADRHFHTGIDIDVANLNVPARTIENGIVYTIGDDCIEVEHESVVGSGNYDRRSKYCHLEDNLLTNANVHVDDIVNANDILARIQPNSSNNGDHLHLEMRQNVNSIRWFRLNVFGNDMGWNLNCPTDGYDPQINDIYIEPIRNQANNVGSGFVIQQTNGSIKIAAENTAKIHFVNKPQGPLETIYQPSTNKLIVYGNIAPIVNVRDRGINNLNASGNGATIKILSYTIEDNYRSRDILKFDLNFDRIPQENPSEVYMEEQVFHTTFNTGTDWQYGNNDYIELRSLDDTYVYPQKMINGIQSNGIWFTKATNITQDVFRTTPTEVALVNSVALYSDGSYTLRFDASDAASRATSESLNVIVDNYRPFIQRVEARLNNSSGNIIYLGQWNYQNNALTFSSSTPNNLSIGNNVWIKVTASEPMRNIELIAFGQPARPLTESKTNPKEWTTTYTSYQVSFGNQTLEFTSHSVDLADNPIQECNANADIITDNEIPKRQNNGTWLPVPLAGSDTKHRLNVSNAINIDFTFTPNYGAFPLEVQFSDITVANIDGWEWDFNGEGTANSTTVKNPKVNYKTPGVKSVSLKLFKKGLLVGELNKKNITISDQLFADFTANNTSGVAPLVVKFENRSSSNAARFSWNFGDNTTSTEKSPTHTYTHNGIYDVSLSVFDVSGTEDFIQKNSFIYVSNSTITISGKIEEQIGFSAIPDVELNFEGLGQTFSDNNGHYSYNVPYGWSGYIRASKIGYDFLLRNIDNITSEQGIDFIGFKRDDFRLELNPLYPEQGDYVTVTPIGVPLGATNYDWCVFYTVGYETYAHIISEGAGWNHSFFMPGCNTSYSLTVFIRLSVKDQNGDTQYARTQRFLWACQEQTSSTEPVYGNEIRLGYPFVIQDKSEPYANEICFEVHWNFPNNHIFYCTPHGKSSGSCGHPLTYGGDRQVSFTYGSKGRYTYRTKAIDAGNTSREIWNGVIIVDCDETTTQADLQNAVYDDWGDIHQYYSGNFTIGDLPISHQDDKKVVFKACNKIVLTDGFNASPSSGNYLKIIGNYDPLQISNMAKIESINETCENEATISEITELDSSRYINIYPNPNNGRFILEFGDMYTKIALVEIFNSTGGLILSKKGTFQRTEEINIKNQIQGIYFIKIYNDRETIVRKIVKY